MFRLKTGNSSDKHEIWDVILVSNLRCNTQGCLFSTDPRRGHFQIGISHWVWLCWADFTENIYRTLALTSTLRLYFSITPVLQSFCLFETFKYQILLKTFKYFHLSVENVTKKMDMRKINK
jgi:hypothetical protein